MVDKVKHWTTNLLTYAGRQQLVKSVLMVVTGNFLWSGKVTGRKAYVAWEKVCEPKNAGGLNIKNLEEWNNATMLKMLRDIHIKADKFWIRWLDTYCMKGMPIMQWQPKTDSSWMIKKIIKCRNMIMNSDYWDHNVVQKRFQTADMYKDIQGESTPVTWRKLFLHNFARPHAFFTMWLVMHGTPIISGTNYSNGWVTTELAVLGIERATRSLAKLRKKAGEEIFSK